MVLKPKKFNIVLAIFVVILPMAAVWAHGNGLQNDHMSTQIGLEDAFKSGESEGLTREEISLMVLPTLTQEDDRASVKFIILAVLLYAVGWLFYPKSADSQINPPQAT